MLRPYTANIVALRVLEVTYECQTTIGCKGLDATQNSRDMTCHVRDRDTRSLTIVERHCQR